MSQAVLNLLAKKVLKDTAAKNINAKDPYFEEIPIVDKRGNATGKIKKQKKGVPLGVTPHDGDILKSVRRKAYRLDMSLFNFCGIKFGWSSVIGIVPGIGDVIDFLMAWMVVRKADKIEGGLPAAIKSRMLFNIVLDFAIGLVPFLGDIADAVFRANTRNAWILEEYLVKKAEAERKGGGDLARGVKEVVDDEGPDRPPAAKTTPSSGGGFFGRGKERSADVEMGMAPGASVQSNGVTSPKAGR